MSDVELPEVDSLDTPFKKRVVLTAAVLVLCGGLLALGVSRASAEEQRLSAEAQAATITASAGYGEAFAELAKDAGSDAELRSLRQQAELARVHAALTGVPGYDDEAQALDTAAGGLADLGVPESEASHYDEVNADALDLLLEPRVSALSADAKRETAAGWAAKADRYVLGITLLAVALSLLGLSLTLARGTRLLMVAPAVLIGGAAGVVSVLAALSQPDETPEEAIRSVAEGDRLMGLREYDDALDAYTEAIDRRADYALAYRARGTAWDLAGSPETAGYVFTTVDPEYRARAIEDLDRALELNAVPDYLTLVNQGANVFHVGDYARSEALTRRALATNDRLPLPWGNLGMAQAAQGKAEEARASIREAIERTLARPDPVEQQELFAAARSALEILAELEPSRAELVTELQGLLVSAQAEAASPGDNPAGDDAEITGLALTVNGQTLSATFDRANLPTNSRVSFVGYYRPDDDSAWQQLPYLVLVNRVPETAPGPLNSYLIDLSCPGTGEYRLDAWLDDRRLATATAPVTAEGDRYVVSYDPSSRITACRPEDWEIDDSVPGTIRLGGPQRTRVAVRAVPLPAELIGLPDDTVTRTALDTEPTCNGYGPPDPDRAFNVGYVVGTSRQYAARPDGRIAWCWAGLGLDGLLRVLVTEYDSGPDGPVAAVNDLVARLYFNDVAPPA